MSTARGFLGAGDLYVARYNPVSQAFDQFEGPFESTKFEIKPNADLKEQASRGKTTYGQIIESVPLPKPSDLTVTFAEVDRVALGMALFGTVETLNSGSGAVTNEAHTAKLGYWTELANANIATAGFAVTNVGGTVTYTLGTDYEVNYALGMVKPLVGGAITEGGNFEVDYTHNAISGTRVRGATQSQVRAKFKLDGINFADQSPCIVNVWEAVLTPDSAFDFMSDSFAEIVLKGRMKTPVGKTEPFTVDLRSA